MFVSDEVALKAGFPGASAALMKLARRGWLGAASDGAYAEGLSGLVRVGPVGDVAGAAKLVRVLLLEPVSRDGSLTLSMRWEATGRMGRLYPVLDANLTLAPDGEAGSRLSLAGAYRPPLAKLGVGLDRVLLHRAAEATVRAFLYRIAHTLDGTGPGGAAPGGAALHGEAPHGDAPPRAAPHSEAPGAGAGPARPAPESQR